MGSKYDAVVVGSGPNGLAAAITLAKAGCSVVVFEADDIPGGGVRTSELTFSGFLHDVCSAVYPLAKASPFFKSLKLEDYGLEWIEPEIPLSHPLYGARQISLNRSLKETSCNLGEDQKNYINLIEPFVSSLPMLLSDVLGPLKLPGHPLLTSRFALSGFQPATRLIAKTFATEEASALFAGLCGHSLMNLERPLTASFGIILAALAHTVGWPISRGGAGKLTQALVSYLQALGGEIVTGRRIESLSELPDAAIILLDLTPKQIVKIGKAELDHKYLAALTRYRYGSGVFKMDFALSEPVPFLAETSRKAGTLHLGGRLEEIVTSESLVAKGIHPDNPFVLFSQPSIFDNTRAPVGKHVAWAYCHVPHGSTINMSERIVNQIERFAPGFRDCIIGQHQMNCNDLQAYNENYVGGDINGGIQDIYQFLKRPVKFLAPYATTKKGLYICSSSTPPGGGVHGMCGYHAASLALRRELGVVL